MQHHNSYQATIVDNSNKTKHIFCWTTRTRNFSREYLSVERTTQVFPRTIVSVSQTTKRYDTYLPAVSLGRTILTTWKNKQQLEDEDLS